MKVPCHGSDSLSTQVCKVLMTASLMCLASCSSDSGASKADTAESLESQVRESVNDFNGEGHIDAENLTTGEVVDIDGDSSRGEDRVRGSGVVPAGQPEVESASDLPLVMVAAVANYDQDIAPIMQKYCVSCHGGVGSDGKTVVEMGLDLTSYAGMMTGSTYGSVLEPRNPNGSLLLEMMESGEMPEDGDKVPADLILVVRNWIAAGAPERP